jgi:hypothetical protein
MIVPYVRIGPRQSVAPQSTVRHMSEIVERRTPRFRTSLVESSLNASREGRRHRLSRTWWSPRWHARRLGDGRSKRTCTDLAERGAVNGVMTTNIMRFIIDVGAKARSDDC